MRFSLLAVLCIYSGLAQAFWTGVAVDLANYDSDWLFDDGRREAQINSLDFQVEEKTEAELRVGAVIGYFDMRVIADSAATNRKFDGQYLGLYLRQPFRITENIALHGSLNLRYASGNESGQQEDEASIDWTSSKLRLGLGFRFGNWRVVPFTAYQHIDGDISDDEGTGVFEMEEAQITGLSFDYFVQQDAFVRLEFRDGGQTGGWLTFARRY